MDNNNKSRTTEQELEAFATLWKEYRKAKAILPEIKKLVYFLKEEDGITNRRLAALTGHEVSPQYFDLMHKQVRDMKGGESK